MHAARRPGSGGEGGSRGPTASRSGRPAIPGGPGAAASETKPPRAFLFFPPENAVLPPQRHPQLGETRPNPCGSLACTAPPPDRHPPGEARLSASALPAGAGRRPPGAGLSLQRVPRRKEGEEGGEAMGEAPAARPPGPGGSGSEETLLPGGDPPPRCSPPLRPPRELGFGLLLRPRWGDREGRGWGSPSRGWMLWGLCFGRGGGGCVLLLSAEKKDFFFHLQSFANPPSLAHTPQGCRFPGKGEEGGGIGRLQTPCLAGAPRGLPGRSWPRTVPPGLRAGGAGELGSCSRSSAPRNPRRAWCE